MIESRRLVYRKKLCVATASRKSFRPRLSSLILLLFFVSFFSFSFFYFFLLFLFFSLAETDDQSSLITESFDMVVQLEVLFGRRKGGGGGSGNRLKHVIKHRPCEYCRIDALSSSVCSPYRPCISTTRRNLDAFAVWWTDCTPMNSFDTFAFDYYFFSIGVIEQLATRLSLLPCSKQIRFIFVANIWTISLKHAVRI